MNNSVKVKVSSSTVLCSTDYFSPIADKEMKHKWLANHRLYEAETTMGPRIVTPVVIQDDESNLELMMDAITGSLYNKSTGECLTSTRLRMYSYKSKPGLDMKLLKMQPEKSYD